MLRILVAQIPMPQNRFLVDLNAEISKHCELIHSSEAFWNMVGDYDVIHLHFPEYLTSGLQEAYKQGLTDELIRQTAERLEYWAVRARLVVTNPYGPGDSLFEVRPDYRPTVLALGRFTHIKANCLTLMAFKQVLESCPEAGLVMVGDGELLECFKTLAQAWGIADRVTFTGAIPHAEILPLFAQACCFVQHSVTPSNGDAEGAPVVILEAQAARPPHSPTPVPVLTVSGAAGAKANSLQLQWWFEFH